MKKAVFLDRDNTLIEDTGYFHDLEKVKFLPGVVEGLYELQSAGFLLIVIANQSGIGRGYFPESDTVAVNKKIAELLQNHNVKIGKFYYCPHSPQMNCECRKPKPFFIVSAADEFGINIAKSFFIGDQIKDMEAGRAAGVASVLIGSIEESSSRIADLHAPDMRTAANLIIDYEKKHRPIQK